MDNSTNNTENQKNLNEMTNTEVLDVLWNALNKANSKGVFSIDEAFTLKVLYDRLKKDI